MREFWVSKSEGRYVVRFSPPYIVQAHFADVEGIGAVPVPAKPINQLGSFKFKRDAKAYADKCARGHGPHEGL